MFEVYEVNTESTISVYDDARLAWSAAHILNNSYSEAMGLEYSVRQYAGGDNV
jgi:hypothetical protein